MELIRNLEPGLPTQDQLHLDHGHVSLQCLRSISRGHLAPFGKSGPSHGHILDAKTPELSGLHLLPNILRPTEPNRTIEPLAIRTLARGDEQIGGSTQGIPLEPAGLAILGLFLPDPDLSFLLCREPGSADAIDHRTVSPRRVRVGMTEQSAAGEHTDRVPTPVLRIDPRDDVVLVRIAGRPHEPSEERQQENGQSQFLERLHCMRT